MNGGLITESRLQLTSAESAKMCQQRYQRTVCAFFAIYWLVRQSPGSQFFPFLLLSLTSLSSTFLVQRGHISGSSGQGLDIDGRQGFSFGTDSDWNALQVGGSRFCYMVDLLISRLTPDSRAPAKQAWHHVGPMLGLCWPMLGLC